MAQSGPTIAYFPCVGSTPSGTACSHGNRRPTITGRAATPPTWSRPGWRGEAVGGRPLPAVVPRQDGGAAGSGERPNRANRAVTRHARRATRGLGGSQPALGFRDAGRPSRCPARRSDGDDRTPQRRHRDGVPPNRHAAVESSERARCSCSCPVPIPKRRPNPAPLKSVNCIAICGRSVVNRTDHPVALGETPRN